MIAAWRSAGVPIHVGYIVGFPEDTPRSVDESVARLADELRADLASLFILTPLPGSRDHRDAVAAGVAMDPDLNRFDTFHAVVDHPTMTRDELEEVYRAAWRRFYTHEHLARQLRSAAERATLLQMYLWHSCALRVDRYHPMMTGFLRLKPRRDRRPGVTPDTLRRHLRRRAPEVATMLAGYARVVRDTHRLWRDAGGAPASRAGSWLRFVRETFGRGAPTCESLSSEARPRGPSCSPASSEAAACRGAASSS